MEVHIGTIIDLIANEFKDVERNVKPTKRDKEIADSIIELLRSYSDGSVFEDYELEFMNGMLYK